MLEGKGHNSRKTVVPRAHLRARGSCTFFVLVQLFGKSDLGEWVFLAVAIPMRRHRSSYLTNHDDIDPAVAYFKFQPLVELYLPISKLIPQYSASSRIF